MTKIRRLDYRVWYILRDAVIITMMDAFTSWFAGCVIFVTLGYMAHKSNVPVGDVVDQGNVIIRLITIEMHLALPYW